MLSDGSSNTDKNMKGKENTKKVNAKKKKRGGSKRKLSVDQLSAYKSVSEWVFLGQSSSSSNPSSSSAISFDDDFRVVFNPKFSDKLVFDLHSHSICSDGYLSPSKLVERAHQNGVSALFFLFKYSFHCLSVCNFDGVVVFCLKDLISGTFLLVI